MNRFLVIPFACLCLSLSARAQTNASYNASNNTLTVSADIYGAGYSGATNAPNPVNIVVNLYWPHPGTITTSTFIGYIGKGGLIVGTSAVKLTGTNATLQSLLPGAEIDIHWGGNEPLRALVLTPTNQP
jgi:hypothetical protein